MINYNGHTRLGDLLDQSVGTLLETDYPSFEVVFLDNGSTDDSASYVAARFPNPRLKVIRSDANLHYASGVNRGLTDATGDVLGVLNNDLIFNPGWLKPLVVYLGNHPAVGVVSPTLLRDERTIDSLGVETNLLMVAWDRFSGEPSRESSPSEPFEVAAPPGAAFLFPRRILSMTNGSVMDDEYVVFHEDVDLGLRLFLMGFKTVMVPASAVIHKRGSSLGLMSPNKLYLIRRNGTRTGVKLLGSKSLFFVPIWFAATAYASYVYYAMSGDSGYLLVPFREGWSTVASFRSIWKKHVDFERLRSVSPRELPLSDTLIINVDRIGWIGRVGITFFNLVAGLTGLGRFKITRSQKYGLFGRYKRS